MRHLILAAAAVAMLSSVVSAREPAMKIAMGPTSAAHFPINQQRGTPFTDCTLPHDQCPSPHRTPNSGIGRPSILAIGIFDID